MAISRMQQPRQQYGLGSIVKKAVRGVKKIVKSPIGKMALLGGAGYMLGGAKFLGGSGMFSGGQGLSRFGNLANLFRASGVGGAAQGKRGLLAGAFYDKDGKFSAGRAGLTGLGLASMAPLFMGGDNEEVEESVTQLDPLATVQSAKNYYSGKGDAGVGLNFMPKKKYVSQNFYAADGGRANFAMGGDTDDEDEIIRMQAATRMRPAQTFLNMGGDAGNAQAEQMLMAEFVKYKNKGGDLSFEQFVKAVMQQQAPEGAGMEQPQPVMMAANGGPVPDSTVPGYTTPAGYNKFDYRSGGVPVRVGAQEGGIMESEAAEMIDMGGMEKDFRNEGGFVAMGGKERADDVPARLSKNEFVFTADAVRNAGGGDIDAGAEVMENLMNNLEQGGEISEESQGLQGAQEMYDQQQMLQSRIV